MDIEGFGEQPWDNCFLMLQSWKKKLPSDVDAKTELENALRSAGYKDLLSELFYNQSMITYDQIRINY